MNRRSMLTLSAAAPLAMAAAPAGEFLGEVPVRTGASIQSSPLSVGFETLDRRHFDPEKTYDSLGRLGVKWARVQTGWSRCETRKGEFDFAWLDGIVDSIRARGVQPWFNLTYGNKLYAPDSPLASAVGWAPIFDEESRKAWARFVQRLAEHFRTRVTHWELWNEPDIKVFWKPRDPSPAGYADLVKLTAPLIRRAIPGAVIVGGGFAMFRTNFDYIQATLEAGLADHVDRISYHDYQPRPEVGYDCRVRALRAMVQKRKPGMRLWQGETGAPAAKGGVGAMGNFPWTEQSQAKFLLRRMLSDLGNEVELSSYFHLVDLVGYGEGSSAASANEKVALFGLLRRDYTPRPSYRAFQCLCALFDSATRKADFVADVRPVAGSASDSVYALSFERKGMPLYCWWQPADLMRENAPGRAEGSFWSTAASRISDPVLIDPLTARVTSVGDMKATGGYWHAKALPLLDYPMILTDRKVAL